MDLVELQRKLIAAARANPPSDSVPYAFEKRILAHLANRTIDHGALWAGALWRAAAPCVAIMMLLATWSFFGTEASQPIDDLDQEFENTVLAVADQDPSTDSTW